MDARSNLALVPFSENGQREIIAQYNANKITKDKIPILFRNAESGWPFVQISFFSPVGEGQYENVLGGFKCHDFKIPAFGLATLVAKIAGKVSASRGSEKEFNRDQFNFDNFGGMSGFIDGFSITHACGFQMSSEVGMFGKLLKINMPMGEPNELAIALDKIFSQVVKGIKPITEGMGATTYSAAQIENSINHDFAILHEGQIHLDLGKFFDHFMKNPDTKDFFKSIFKVNEFLDLKKQHPEFRPTAHEVALGAKALEAAEIQHKAQAETKSSASHKSSNGKHHRQHKKSAYEIPPDKTLGALDATALPKAAHSKQLRERRAEAPAAAVPRVMPSPPNYKAPPTPVTTTTEQASSKVEMNVAPTPSAYRAPPPPPADVSTFLERPSQVTSKAQTEFVPVAPSYRPPPPPGLVPTETKRDVYKIAKRLDLKVNFIDIRTSHVESMVQAKIHEHAAQFGLDVKNFKKEDLEKVVLERLDSKSKLEPARGPSK